MTLRNAATLAIAVLVAEGVAATAPRTQPGAAHRLVSNLERRWTTAFNRGDARSVASLYEADAWLLLPGAPPVKGRHAIGDAIGGMAVRGATMMLTTDRVAVLTQGIIVENGTATYQALGRPPVRSSYQMIWRRDRDGRWRAVRDVVTPL